MKVTKQDLFQIISQAKNQYSNGYNPIKEYWNDADETQLTFEEMRFYAIMKAIGLQYGIEFEFDVKKDYTFEKDKPCIID